VRSRHTRLSRGIRRRFRALEPSLRAKLNQVDKTIVDLAKPPVNTDPIQLHPSWREQCDQILQDLKNSL